MTTILTPVAELKVGDMFCIGAAIYTYVSLFAVNLGMTTLTSSDLRVIFPDGVPVIQPDKPKEVRAVIERTGNVFYVHLYPNPTVMGWVLDHTDPGKTYDLVLTEREEK